jgi:DNA-binding transcriptional LysR family regulator
VAVATSTEDWRVAAAVLECGSVSEAARRLGRQQPTVSRALQRLEHELGVGLFSRQPRFEPTAAGVALLPHALEVVAAADAALAAVAAAGHGTSITGCTD